MTTAPRPAPEEGLLLRLAAPLQSWGHHSHFNERDTAPFPTRSGVIGLLAAALGRTRNEPVDDLATLSLTVRTDRPGVPLRDLHTVGGGLPARDTVTTAEGKKRSGDTTTLLTHRTYLADAAFTAALTATERTPASLLQDLVPALHHPHWPLYLGRRSCPPEGPLLLGASDDALHHLIHLPIAAPPPRPDTDPGVTFTSDQPLNRLPVPPALHTPDAADGDTPAGAVNDQPTTFHPRRRTYSSRTVYQRTLHPPTTQYTELGAHHLLALSTYTDQHLSQPERSRR
ncbi:type I-E CRISPR-associated protein Cas5/CasD [Streptomyces somaliensis]|uniref:Type I-E CRISPR-associated protein Cas5/CasD n=1 Tax=Streptomyces somaliensis (strain ATCC 33201 / DSM 40738 / JCM 12659 / KCTC 9044 / NCTC 11332 / NRRL B-12077 / IP 733) TaxID=1134445 RepID=A0AA44DDS6_STRE0|nr:type I-E CRISPR-associated protein Cas5/CasD [Streptomyces somaliensis]NKY14321.1 type I-E CRISPR-associated protein Cas5/CasD [Streptomyces somaliensis DSM 40738]